MKKKTVKKSPRKSQRDRSLIFDKQTFGPQEMALANLPGSAQMLQQSFGIQEAKPVERTFNESNRYYHVLNEVIDPEAGIGIVDMGLIYAVEEKNGEVTVTMTLTSMGCPAGPQLTTDVDGVLRLQKGVKDVQIQVVWDPAWSPEMMNPDVRAMMFGGF